VNQWNQEAALKFQMFYGSLEVKLKNKILVSLLIWNLKCHIGMLLGWVLSSGFHWLIAVTGSSVDFANETVKLFGTIKRYVFG
jgi:hypothetical protein